MMIQVQSRARINGRFPPMHLERRWAETHWQCDRQHPAASSSSVVVVLLVGESRAADQEEEVEEAAALPSNTTRARRAINNFSAS